MPRITQISVHQSGGHDHVSVWIDHQMTGTITVSRGDGAWLERLLQSGQAHEDMRELIERSPNVPALQRALREASLPVVAAELERQIEQTPAPPSDALEAYERTKRAGEGD